MNTSSLTGVVLAAAAIVWLAFFVPAWVKRDQTVIVTREATRQIKQRVRAEFKIKTRSYESLVRKAARVTRARQVLGTVTLLGLVVTPLTLIDVAKLWGFSLASVVVTASALIGNRALARVQTQVRPIAGVQRPANYAELYRAAQVFAEKAPASGVPQVETAGWVPRNIPAPLHVGHVGTLEQPVLADVVQLEPAQEQIAVSGANLDEILRRRRAI
ncbi:MAG: hypothetical protein ACKOWK_02085 [Micrococcales bacterium]